MKQQIIQQGAEAVLIKRGKEVVKDRIVKGYRYPDLDKKIRKNRTKREARLLEKAGKVICVPKVREKDRFEIVMEFIDGKKLSEHLDKLKNWKEVCRRIGENIAKVHDADIIHGDLTTSNMIWVGGKKGLRVGENSPQLSAAAEIDGARSACTVSRKQSGKSGLSNGEVYFIDFGLGFDSAKVEDKAVDLHLIKQALEAKHFGKWEEYWKEIERSYQKVSNKGEEVMKRLAKVEKRGRYKQQY
jgi:tRNA A-37 threonylcarbamoyl transferase component Bud32